MKNVRNAVTMIAIPNDGVQFLGVAYKIEVPIVNCKMKEILMSAQEQFDVIYPDGKLNRSVL